MKKNRPYSRMICLAAVMLLSLYCKQVQVPKTRGDGQPTLIEAFVQRPDQAFGYEVVNHIQGAHFDHYVIRMTSQKWLPAAQISDPVWWHWLSVAVPHRIESSVALLWIGGGSRNTAMPEQSPALIAQTAMLSGTIAAELHNVPNQPLIFEGDPYGPRKEDELLAYGWRQFMDGGSREHEVGWLGHFPMTKASVRAMDVLQDFANKHLGNTVDSFTVAGASKRGWTTWMTAVADGRVKAIVPVVIDMLNIIPSFEHHWQAYGFWAPAVGDYVREGIMDRQHTPEYRRMIAITEPYSFRHRLTMPKFIINAADDQFFLPDSWQFYWHDLPDAKYLRYVPNADHSLRGTDAIHSLIAFHRRIALHLDVPDIAWQVENGKFRVAARHGIPDAVKLWQAHNADARDFRLETIGPVWTATELQADDQGRYEALIPTAPRGWTASMVEVTFGKGPEPSLKYTTGIQIKPDEMPFSAFQPPASH